MPRRRAGEVRSKEEILKTLDLDRIFPTWYKVNQNAGLALQTHLLF